MASATTSAAWFVLVASLDDLARMKRAAGRPKDVVYVAELAVIRDRRAAS